ncbi:MAG: hypothetical protein HY000_09635 [Planctomycetes bacterium]|nr:hypothetical protein [Planctomycetota bacterium]
MPLLSVDFQSIVNELVDLLGYVKHPVRYADGTFTEEFAERYGQKIQRGITRLRVLLPAQIDLADCGPDVCSALERLQKHLDEFAEDYQQACGAGVPVETIWRNIDTKPLHADLERLMGYVPNAVWERREDGPAERIALSEEPADQTPSDLGRKDEPQLNLDSLPALISAPDWAKILKQPVSRVESFLRRFRKKNPQCFVPAEQPKPNQPRCLYWTVAVWPSLETVLKEKWQAE